MIQEAHVNLWIANTVPKYISHTRISLYSLNRTCLFLSQGEQEHILRYTTYLTTLFALHRLAFEFRYNFVPRFSMVSKWTIITVSQLIGEVLKRSAISRFHCLVC